VDLDHAGSVRDMVELAVQQTSAQVAQLHRFKAAGAASRAALVDRELLDQATAQLVAYSRASCGQPAVDGSPGVLVERACALLMQAQALVGVEDPVKAQQMLQAIRQVQLLV
jgi:hypothetical protein